MFKKKGLIILSLVLLILLAGNYNVSAYHPYDQDTIMIYFTELESLKIGRWTL